MTAWRNVPCFRCGYRRARHTMERVRLAETGRALGWVCRDKERCRKAQEGRRGAAE